LRLGASIFLVSLSNHEFAKLQGPRPSFDGAQNGGSRSMVAAASPCRLDMAAMIAKVLRVKHRAPKHGDHDAAEGQALPHV
jgi:hypothetical protein